MLILATSKDILGWYYLTENHHTQKPAEYHWNRCIYVKNKLYFLLMLSILWIYESHMFWVDYLSTDISC